MVVKSNKDIDMSQVIKYSLWTWFASIWLGAMLAVGISPYNSQLSESTKNITVVNTVFYLVTVCYRSVFVDPQGR